MSKFMHRRYITILAFMSLTSCAAPITLGREGTTAPVRSAAFGPYPEIDRNRCRALTQEQAAKLYMDILETGRCNPNNHHLHDGDHNHINDALVSE